MEFDFATVIGVSEPDEDFDKLRAQLKRIENALEAGDVDSAKALMREHMGHLRKVVGEPLTGSGLEEERDRVAEGMYTKDGVICGACDRIAKARSLPFSINNAIALIWMKRYHDLHPGDFVHVPSRAPKFMGKDGEFSRLLYWGLIEQAPNDDPKKRSSGLWRIVQRGIEFVEGRLRIQREFVRYNSTLLGFRGPMISLTEGIPFDYRDLRSVDLSGFEGTYERLLSAQE